MGSNLSMENFTQTSDKLYEKHTYQLVYKNGDKQVFENYYDLMFTWTNTKKDLLSYVEVLDNKNKSKNVKGFL